jgi:hypothetical protein
LFVGKGTWTYYQSAELGWFADRSKWEGLKSVGMVEPTREVNGKKTVERRYYLSSLALARESVWAGGARTLGRGEQSPLDARRVVSGRSKPCRAGYAAENLATLRRLALNLLKREPTKKRGIKGKQLNAGWDHD